MLVESFLSAYIHYWELIHYFLWGASSPDSESSSIRPVGSLHYAFLSSQNDKYGTHIFISFVERLIQGFCLLLSEDWIRRVEKHQYVDRIDHTLILASYFRWFSCERHGAMRQVRWEVMMEEHHILKRARFLYSLIRTCRNPTVPSV